MDLQTLIDRRTQYLAAEAAVLKRQEYQIDVEGGSRRVRFADLAEIRAAIKQLSTDIEAAQHAAAGRRRVRYIRKY
jgi:hypothetical protein